MNDTRLGKDDPPYVDALHLDATVLRMAEARYQRAFARSEAAREARNALVRDALNAGWTHAQIANATGLTRGRIGQIAQRS